MVVASVLSLTFSGMVFSRVTLSDCDMQSTDGSKYSVSQDTSKSGAYSSILASVRCSSLKFAEAAKVGAIQYS